jgi:hypothetical protein
MQWSFFGILVSSIVIEINILLIHQIVDHFMRHPLLEIKVCIIGRFWTQVFFRLRV